MVGAVPVASSESWYASPHNPEACLREQCVPLVLMEVLKE